MSEVKTKHIESRELGLASVREAERSLSRQALTRSDILSVYRVAEFVTLARDASPVCWPLFPDFERGRLIFSTGYVYPTKAHNAQRNPRVAALYSDPTASGRSDEDPSVLVQGLAEVFDQDLQRNTERYVDQFFRKGPTPFRVMLRIPRLRQLLVGYLTRIWIEVIPRQEYVWARTEVPPEPLQRGRRPDSFSPAPGIKLPDDVFEWLPRYARLPVLSYIDNAGWPAIIRTRAKVRRDRIEIESDIEMSEGAPACLTYHRLVGNYRANDAFIVRGHFNTAGCMIPERVVCYGGTRDDRGVGSAKLMRMLFGFRKQLARQLEKEGRPMPVVRRTPGA